MILTSKSELELEYENYGKAPAKEEFDPEVVQAMVM